MRLSLLLALGATFLVKAQNLTPELLYYNFENVAGSTVPNLATNPSTGTATATIVGNYTVGANGVCPGNALIGTSSTSAYLNPNWNFNLNGSWSIHMKLGNYINNVTGTLYYFFGDSSSQFRAFTNGLAGSNNIMLRGNNISDITLNGVFDTNQNSQKDVVFTYDHTTGVLKGYVNGVLNATVNTSTGLNLSGSTFKIGGYGSNTGLKTGMTMDEFGLYSRALTDSEVAALAANCSLLAVEEAGTASPTKTKVFVHNSELILSRGYLGNYQILDASGRVVDAGSSKSNTIDISKLSKGVYYIKTDEVNIRFIY